jgi:hypothetical protein
VRGEETGEAYPWSLPPRGTVDPPVRLDVRRVLRLLALRDVQAGGEVT